MTEQKTPKRKRTEVVDPVVLVERLKMLMGLRKLTQAQLADRADIARSALTQFFAGERKPSADALVKLANALGVSTDYLLGRTEDTVIADLLQHEKVIRLIELFRRLSDVDQERIIEMIHLMAQTAEYKSSV